MSKALFTLVTLSALGTVGFIASQALTPASLKAQQQAKELLQTIELVPSSPAPSSKAQESPEAVITKPEQVVVQRNHYLDAAIASLDNRRKQPDLRARSLLSPDGRSGANSNRRVSRAVSP